MTRPRASTRLPCDHQSLLAVNGVGQHKLARYGEQFLAAIRAHLGGE